MFDANILLGLYRYSDSTRKDFLYMLDFIKQRCWLPHQAVKEYFGNRLSVIGHQEQSYVDIVKSISDIETQFKNSKQHPFLSEKALVRLCKEFEAVKAELESSRKSHVDRITNDEILSSLEVIFDGRVGDAFSEPDMKKIASEGEDRYKRNIPPGFKDSKKEDPCDEFRKFGDLILWKQMIEYAKFKKLGVIFVCDDRKEDWWMEFKGRTIGPRPELIEEFVANTGLDFHMYSSDRFLEFASNHFKKNVSKGSVSEIREMRKLDQRHRDRLVRDTYSSEIRHIRDLLVREERECDDNLKLLQLEDARALHMSRIRDKILSRVESEDPSALSEGEFAELHLVTERLNRIQSDITKLRERIELGTRRRNLLQHQLTAIEGAAGGYTGSDESVI